MKLVRIMNERITGTMKVGEILKKVQETRLKVGLISLKNRAYSVNN